MAFALLYKPDEAGSVPRAVCGKLPSDTNACRGATFALATACWLLGHPDLFDSTGHATYRLKFEGVKI
jgi:hypothetical protein